MSSTDPSPTTSTTPDTGSAPSATAPAKAKSAYGNPSFADIARSMAVLGAVLVGLFLLGQLVWGNDAEERPGVDYAQTVESVRQTAPYPIYAPTSLPDGWRSNGVSFEPGEQGRWHLGVLTDDDRYIGLEQANASAQRMVDQYASGAEQRGAVDIDGVTWQRWSGAGETAYVREEGQMTVLVGGPAPRDDIERYLGLLATS